MNIIENPPQKKWNALALRPVIDKELLKGKVEKIIETVKKQKDNALLKFSKEFDGVELLNLKVSNKEVKAACTSITDELKQAINLAKNNIEIFHKSQQEPINIIETSKGVTCWQKNVGIQKVGLYIPGGSAPLFSTILMLGIPAKLANCTDIILCTPPNNKGKIHPAILYTANLIGIHNIYKVGGAQAIAAMAYGTETIPNVYKIFGPGNQFVTMAKELIQLNGIAIDMPAGPSEVLIIADTSCNPKFVAADLLSQAEHGIDSQVILLSNSKIILDKTIIEIQEQIVLLPRKEIIKKVLKNSKFILLNTIKQCINFSNIYAPEHLIIASKNSSNLADKVINAGSVFLGNYSCESAGDYASGTNHTLPTNGYAKNYSGIVLNSFCKTISFQKITKQGLKNIGNAIEVMANTEELFAHKNAVTVRLKSINNV